MIYFMISGFCPHPKLPFCIQRVRGTDKVKDKIIKQRLFCTTTLILRIKLYQLPNLE